MRFREVRLQANGLSEFGDRAVEVALVAERHPPVKVGLGVVRLETGIHQREAIALYESGGFRRIGPFGPYTDDPLSRCYEKAIAAVPFSGAIHR